MRFVSAAYKQLFLSANTIDHIETNRLTLPEERVTLTASVVGRARMLRWETNETAKDASIRLERVRRSRTAPDTSLTAQPRRMMFLPE